MPDHEFRSPIAVGGQARSLIEHARRLEAAQTAMHKHLPGEFKADWQLARLDSTALVIVTDSAAKATRLRYLRAALLKAAEEVLGTRPASFSVKLSPPRLEPQPPEPATLTAEAAHSLQLAMQGLEDEPLRQALARLAARAKGKKPAKP